MGTVQSFNPADVLASHPGSVFRIVLESDETGPVSWTGQDFEPIAQPSPTAVIPADRATDEYYAAWTQARYKVSDGILYLKPLPASSK